MSIKHAFVSTKSDGSDTSLVRPSDWNAGHNGGGKEATLTVAASNASTDMIAQADYACDGTADDVQIQAAIDALSAGRVLITEGTFNITSTISLSGKTDIILEGQGWGTNIVAPSSGTLSKGIQVGESGSVATRCWVKNLRLTGDTGLTGSSEGIYFGTTGGDEAVNCGAENIYVNNWKSPGVSVKADGIKLINCYVISNGVGVYSNGADKLLLIGGLYKDTNTFDTGEVLYIDGGNDVFLVGTRIEQTTANGETIDWRAISGGGYGVDIIFSGSGDSSGLIIAAAGVLSGTWIGGRISQSNASATAGAGIDCRRPNWTFDGITFSWWASGTCILLQTDAANIGISNCVAIKGANFVRCLNIAGGVSLVNNIASGSSIDTGVRVDTSSVNFAGLYARGNFFNDMAGYAYRWVESGGFTASKVDIDDADLSGNTSGVLSGAATGGNAKYNALIGYNKRNSGVASNVTLDASGVGVIAHSCDTTPTYANVICQSANLNVRISSIDATNINIVVYDLDNAVVTVDTHDFYWEVK